MARTVDRRKESGKGRTTGAMKKVRELSTLCGVDACLIIVPKGGDPSQLQVWPPLPEAMRIIDRYRSMPELEQRRKKMDGEDYVRERIGKVKEQLSRAERDNRQRETTLLLHDAMVGRCSSLEGLTVEQLVGIGWSTEHLGKKIKDSIVYRGGQQQAVVKAEPLPYAATATNIEAPQLRQGWVMPLVKAERDLDALACSGSRGGSGSYGSAGAAGGYVMQLGNMDPRFAWAHPGTYFPPV